MKTITKFIIILFGTLALLFFVGLLKPTNQYFFSVSDCDWGAAEYLGFTSVFGFSAQGGDKNPNFLAVQVLDGDGKVSHTTKIKDPQYVPSLNKNYSLRRCRFIFSVALPRWGVGATKAFSIRKTTAGIDLSPTQSTVGKKLDKLPNFKVSYNFEGSSPESYRIVKLQQSKKSRPYRIVILGDGFTSEELELSSDQGVLNSKFGDYSKKLVSALFKFSPFLELKESIEIILVATPSQESGTDVPSKRQTKNTFYDSSVDVHCLSRLAGVKNYVRVLQMAELAKFDVAVMLINSKVYAGAGGVVPITTLADFFEARVIHEMGHTIGGLEDQYYVYADKGTISECKDRNIEMEILTNNQIHSSSPPNISSSENITEVKWKEFVSKGSPVISFTYPIEAARLDQNNKTVHFEYALENDKPELILLAGPTSDWNREILKFSSIDINGKKYLKSNFILYKASLPVLPSKKQFGIANTIDFLKLRKKLNKGTLRISLIYENKKRAKFVFELGKRMRTLAIPSKIFDPHSVGLFQGANSDPYHSWRSSYNSMMGAYSKQMFKFDPVEQKAIRTALESVINKEN